MITSNASLSSNQAPYPTNPKTLSRQQSIYSMTSHFTIRIVYLTARTLDHPHNVTHLTVRGTRVTSLSATQTPYLNEPKDVITSKCENGSQTFCLNSSYNFIGVSVKWTLCCESRQFATSGECRCYEQLCEFEEILNFCHTRD